MSAARKMDRSEPRRIQDEPLSPEVVTRWMTAILDTAQHVEVRHFDSRGRAASRRFGPDERSALVETALRLSAQRREVYFTFNPLLPDTSGTATDVMVERRTRLLIDCDPTRDEAAVQAAGKGAKLSATDAEKAHAIRMGSDVRAYLRSMGWPDAVESDSGNGDHSLYAVDLPNDEASRDLVKAVLVTLAHRFDTAEAQIDTVVYNASRITKFYGTVARKGTATAERPHRVSRVLSVPDGFGDRVVTREQLEAVAELPAVAGTIPVQPEGPSMFSGKVARLRATASGQWSPERRAVAYLEKCEPAVSGQKGHSKAFKAACKVGPGFDLSPDTAFRLLWEVYNPTCDPPWSEKELRHKVDDAYAKETRRGWLLNEPRKSDRNGHHATNGQSNGPPGPGDPKGTNEADDRPTIICGSEEPEEGLKTWTPKGLEALAMTNTRVPSVFQRSGKLARLRMPTEDDEPPVIETIGADALRGILDRAAYWGNVEITRKGPAVRYGPPRVDIVKDIMSLGSLDPAVFPPIEAVVESPIFGADGRLILEAGYHREAKLYYAPSPDLRRIRVPTKPTPDDVQAALALIFDELLPDFPFRNEASKANALAVMLLPFVRLMITGPTPNHHFTSSTEGVGKGKCANACAFPFLGRKLDINPQKESEAEWRKALTSFFMSGSSHYFIDNMYNPAGWDDVLLDVDSGTLAAAWTGERWKDRILGGNDEAKVQIHAVFMSAGNNVAFSRELTRRLVNIEIVAVSEDPSLRTNFKHDPIEEWARDNRAALTRACLTLCSNWIARGRKPGNCTMGSYESYAQTMGGVLEAAGVGGFLDNRPKAGAARDRESIRWPALVSAWHKDRGGMATSAGMVYDLVFGDPGIPELQIAFADVVGDGKPLSQKQRFGHAIGKQDGRVWAGHRVVRTGAKTADGVVLFRLVDPSEDEPDE